jgi:hypothetical protein
LAADAFCLSISLGLLPFLLIGEAAFCMVFSVGMYPSKASPFVDFAAKTQPIQSIV